MFKVKQDFVAALGIVAIVFVVLALPYAAKTAYGPEATELVLFVRLVFLTVFSVIMLIWWLVRYRQTSHDLKMLREEIERNKPSREKPEKIHMRKGNQKRA